MTVSVPMPRLGESVSEGTVTRWLKQEGERVEADEPLLEVSTDKVDTEIPSPVSGTVLSIKVQEDETVEVGVELVVIDDGSGGGETAGEPAASEEPAAQEAAPEPPAAEPPAAEEAAPEPPAQEQPAAEEAAPEPPTAEEPAAEEPVAEEAAPKPAPAPAEPAKTSSEPPTSSTPAAQTSAAAPAPAGSGAESAYVTPLVRKLASEHGVDLSSLTGTGVGGRVRKQDVLDAAAQSGGAGQSSAPAAAGAAAPSGGTSAPAAAPVEADQASSPRAQLQQPAGTPANAPAYVDQAVQAAPDTQVRGRTEPMSRLRKVIAARMTESLQVSAQLTTVLEADVTKIARLRASAKDAFAAKEGTKLSFMPFFAVATVEALKAHPVVNSSLDEGAGTITYHDAVHLGIAVDSDRGLLVPVIHDAGDLNLAGTARKIADLADRTRTNRVTPDELGGGTFTLTNTGSRGALFDTPIINQPQVGILGTGAVVKRPVVIQDPELGEVIAIRSMVYLALTYDHRIVDGADAARFLVTVKERLEEGDFAAELGL